MRGCTTEADSHTMPATAASVLGALNEPVCPLKAAAESDNPTRAQKCMTVCTRFFYDLDTHIITRTLILIKVLVLFCITLFIQHRGISKEMLNFTLVIFINNDDDNSLHT